METNLGDIVRVVQAKLRHELWASAYGITVSDADRETVHLRSAEEILNAPGPLVITMCRGFAVATVALLRERGVEARARCGFATYFRPDWFEDHWVVEYRDGAGTWRLADAQLDEVHRTTLKIEFDPLDMPRDAFLPGPDAWQRARSGATAFDRFGLSSTDMAGEWFVAGNVLRDRLSVEHDVAALPWDVWEPMPGPDEPVDVALFDRLAAGTVPVPVPEKVWNSRRDRVEDLTARP